MPEWIDKKKNHTLKQHIQLTINELYCALNEDEFNRGGIFNRRGIWENHYGVWEP